MMTQEEIAQKKEQLRNNPFTKRIAARLGVSLETFLSNIEAPGPVVDIHGGKNVEARLAVIEQKIRGGLAKAKALHEERAQKRDGFAGDKLRQIDLKKKTVLGHDAW
ncbi:MAG: hypothetical protein U1E65_00245 [Myxococcota bacterium]